ncbi:Rieske (2Fe-2S) protein [Streptomyces sp. NPDC053048]|uniref:Rieske (2Fe-2S) protein n=1 Tax=Streptomyces sp. NPDC053048 TaxID=3365694 RepID=UPI0037CF0153
MTRSTASPSASSSAPSSAPSSASPSGTTRRTVVATAGVAGLAALLAACGGSGDSNSGSGSGSGSGEKPEGSAGKEPAGKDARTGAGAALARTSDIPEGGGKVFAEQKVVVTQPSKGEFKAFSAVCTHQGCLVKEVSDGTINCLCHKSRFSVADGSVRGGPAQKPLAARQVSVNGDSLTLG